MRLGENGRVGRGEQRKKVTNERGGGGGGTRVTRLINLRFVTMCHLSDVSIGKSFYCDERKTFI